MLVIAPIALGVAELFRRLVAGPPHDLAAYVAAAQTSAAGEDPYGDAIFNAPAYGGYPYVYPPFTLTLLRRVGSLPAPVWSVADWLVRVALIPASCRLLGRRLELRLPLAVLLLGAVLFAPVALDTFAGNLAVVELALLLWLVHRTGRAACWTDLPVGAVVLVGAAVKPTWLLPAVAMVLLMRRGRLALGLAAGAAVVAAGSWLERDLHAAWIQRLQVVRTYWQDFDLLALSVWVYLAAAVGWASFALYLAARRHPQLWVWCCTSLVAWPRLRVYALTAAAPGLLLFGKRRGWRQALLLLAPLATPLPLILRAVAGDTVSNYWYLGWLTLLTGLVASELHRSSERLES
jgi:hypothetical protein